MAKSSTLNIYGFNFSAYYLGATDAFGTPLSPGDPEKFLWNQYDQSLIDAAGSLSKGKTPAGNASQWVIGDDGGADNWTGGNGIDVFYGRGGNDEAHGGRGDDWLNGGAGSDKLYGDNGQDFLFGGEANDELFGGSGHDYLNGESGDDQLTGGVGNDMFAFNWAFELGDERVVELNGIPNGNAPHYLTNGPNAGQINPGWLQYFEKGLANGYLPPNGAYTGTESDFTTWIKTEQTAGFKTYAGVDTITDFTVNALETDSIRITGPDFTIDQFNDWKTHVGFANNGSGKTDVTFDFDGDSSTAPEIIIHLAKVDFATLDQTAAMNWFVYA